VSDHDAVPRRRLPDIALPPLDGGPRVALRAPRQGTVLVLLGAGVGERDGAYLRALAAAEPELRGWDGRVLVVVEGADPEARTALDALALPFPVLADPDGAVTAAAGVAAPAVAVVDQWGEVHAARGAGAEEPWLPVREVEQWLRFLSIRCAG
jgi:hypothetical protein